MVHKLPRYDDRGKITDKNNIWPILMNACVKRHIRLLKAENVFMIIYQPIMRGVGLTILITEKLV